MEYSGGRVRIVADQQEVRVPSGTPDQAKGGDTLSPSQVYFFGMSPPWRKAVLVSLNGMSASVIFDLCNKFAKRKANCFEETLTHINGRQRIGCSGNEDVAGGIDGP